MNRAPFPKLFLEAWGNDNFTTETLEERDNSSTDDVAADLGDKNMYQRECRCHGFHPRLVDRHAQTQNWSTVDFLGSPRNGKYHPHGGFSGFRQSRRTSVPQVATYD